MTVYTKGFARVRIASGRYLTIKIISEVGGKVKGWRVDDKTGEKWDRSKMVDGVLHTTEELVLAHTSDIVKRLRLNLHYGELEESKCST